MLRDLLTVQIFWPAYVSDPKSRSVDLKPNCVIFFQFNYATRFHDLFVIFRTSNVSNPKSRSVDLKPNCVYFLFNSIMQPDFMIYS